MWDVGPALFPAQRQLTVVQGESTHLGPVGPNLRVYNSGNSPLTNMPFCHSEHNIISKMAYSQLRVQNSGNSPRTKGVPTSKESTTQATRL